MLIFPQSPVWFALKFITSMRKHEKCAYKPSLRQALAICRLIMARFMRNGTCELEDFVEIAIVTSPPENQALARQIAMDLLTYSEPMEKKIKDLSSLDLDLLGEVKASDLVTDLDNNFNELDDIYDDFDFLNQFFDDFSDIELEDLLNSLENDFLQRFSDKLLEDPYRTALNVLENNLFDGIEELNDLNELLEKAREVLEEKINQLEPEDIKNSDILEMLDEVIEQTENFRERLASEFLKNNDLQEIIDQLEEEFQNNFFEGIDALDFALNAGLFNADDLNGLKDMVKDHLNEFDKNINDLFELSKIFGSDIDLDEDELENLLNNSMDLPFNNTYETIKNLDRYFGGNICEDYLDKISQNIENILEEENILDKLISRPTKTPSWRKLLEKSIDQEVNSIFEDYENLEDINTQLRNYTDSLVSSRENCSDLSCRSQLNHKLSDLINKTIETSANKKALKNNVNHYSDLGFIPDIESVEKAGKRLNMTDLEIQSLLNFSYKTLKNMMEKDIRDYQMFRNSLQSLHLTPNQVRNLVNVALGRAPAHAPNFEAVGALAEKYLSEVLNAAEALGQNALEHALSALGAGSGLDLLEQWFYSRHNISARVKTKLKEVIKNIMIDLGISSANSLIGTSNSGPIVENIVIPYNIGDDFELIDLEETISNLLEGGKTIEMIENDDFLVSKTSQGLRCLVMELDISGSMSGKKLAQMALCTTMLIYAFNPEELALSFFESNTHKLKNLDEEVEIETIADELLDIRAMGGTCIRSALEWANLQFEKKARSKYKLNILFTDADVFDFGDSLRELEKMKENDVRFVMVVPKFGFSPVMANRMVKKANGVLLTLNQWRDFPKLISDIISNQ